MPRLLKRPEAENDLDEIWLFIAKDNPSNADRLLDWLQEKFLVLADFPQMGTSCYELKNGLRSHVVGNYMIFYFQIDDGIDIVRVLHGARNIESLFTVPTSPNLNLDERVTLATPSTMASRPGQ